MGKGKTYSIEEKPKVKRGRPFKDRRPKGPEPFVADVKISEVLKSATEFTAALDALPKTLEEMPYAVWRRSVEEAKIEAKNAAKIKAMKQKKEKEAAKRAEQGSDYSGSGESGDDEEEDLESMPPAFAFKIKLDRLREYDVPIPSQQEYNMYAKERMLEAVKATGRAHINQTIPEKGFDLKTFLAIEPYSGMGLPATKAPTYQQAKVLFKMIRNVLGSELKTIYTVLKDPDFAFSLYRALAYWKHLVEPHFEDAILTEHSQRTGVPRKTVRTLAGHLYHLAMEKFNLPYRQALQKLKEFTRDEKNEMLKEYLAANPHCVVRAIRFKNKPPRNL